MLIRKSILATAMLATLAAPALAKESTSKFVEITRPLAQLEKVRGQVTNPRYIDERTSRVLQNRGCFEPDSDGGPILPWPDHCW